MMKRILSLLMALLLVCSTLALAEENIYDLIENAMYRIVLRTEKGDELLGSGVLFSEQSLLLTSAACVAEGELVAIGPDGEHRIAAADQVDDTGLALMEMAPPAEGTPLRLTAENAAGLAALFGTAPDGEFLIAPLDHVRTTIFRGQSALMLSSAEGMLPGSFLTDERGGLIGLCIAQSTEGQGAYIALDANGLYRALTRQQYADSFLPVEASWADGVLTIAWTDEERGSGMYLITISGDENQYYTSFEAEHDVRNVSLTVPPAHRYDFQVQWAHSADSTIEPVWGSMTETFIPGGNFDAFGYQQACDFVTRPGEKNQVNPVPEVDRAVLEDASVQKLLRVKATYHVEEETELPMTIELIAPDGQFYFESAFHTLSPEMAKEDAFLLPLDDLIKDCTEFSGGMLQPGQYTVRYAIAGGTAGEYNFTLPEAPIQGEEPLPNVETSGLITDLAAEYNSGAVTISWPADSVPEGANITVCYMYGHNSYYSYFQVAPGHTQTEIYTIPGEHTLVWATWALEGAIPPEPVLESDYLLVPAAEETPFTLNGFRNVRMSLALSDDPHAGDATEFLPDAPLTHDRLMDDSLTLYFQTEDVYQVTEDSEGHPMMLALFTADGLCFAYPLEYLFDVDLQTSDLWLFDLSEMCESYENLICGAWPAGHYRFLYCIDGQVAGEYHFTLE